MNWAVAAHSLQQPFFYHFIAISASSGVSALLIIYKKQAGILKQLIGTFKL